MGISSICHLFLNIQKSSGTQTHMDYKARGHFLSNCSKSDLEVQIVKVSVKHKNHTKNYQEQTLGFQIFETQVHCKAVLLNCFDGGTNIGSTSEARRKQITGH